MARRRSKTHFEQIAVQTVMRIAKVDMPLTMFHLSRNKKVIWLILKAK
jgi:hypothetical protein